eukprot:2501430-Karenia_brevis.AAC.1
MVMVMVMVMVMMMLMMMVVMIMTMMMMMLMMVVGWHLVPRCSHSAAGRGHQVAQGRELAAE